LSAAGVILSASGGFYPELVEGVEPSRGRYQTEAFIYCSPAHLLYSLGFAVAIGRAALASVVSFCRWYTKVLTNLFGENIPDLIMPWDCRPSVDYTTRNVVHLP